MPGAGGFRSCSASLIAPVALYIRRQLPETIDESQTHRSTGAVLGELMRHHSRAVVFGVLIICGGTVSTYVFNYMTTYAITTLHLSATIATALGVAGSVAQIAGLAVGVWLDRHGRKRMSSCPASSSCWSSTRGI